VNITRRTAFVDLPEVLRVNEAAVYLDVSPGSIYEAIRADAIVAIRIGRLVRISKATLAAMTGNRQDTDAR